MKVEIEVSEKEFQPIELRIKIESKEELFNLYHRVNASHTLIEREALDGIIPFTSGTDCYELWVILRDHVKTVVL